MVNGMDNRKAKAFQIEPSDNVATALTAVPKGRFVLLGGGREGLFDAAEDIPQGHKVALCPVKKGEATEDIIAGQWVHLHCMKSGYDERSSGLDIHTGVPSDIAYTGT